MQQKKEPAPKKNYPPPQAPNLIAECKGLGWTQKLLAARLKNVISQQAFSNYWRGKVRKEQHEVIEGLKTIVAKKLKPPTAEEVINSEERHDSSAGSTSKTGSLGAKTPGVGSVSARRNEGDRGRKS